MRLAAAQRLAPIFMIVFVSCLQRGPKVLDPSLHRLAASGELEARVTHLLAHLVADERMHELVHSPLWWTTAGPRTLMWGMRACPWLASDGLRRRQR